MPTMSVEKGGENGLDRSKSRGPHDLALQDSESGIITTTGREMDYTYLILD